MRRPTGGDYIQSTSGIEGQKATFGFTFDNSTGKFKGSYHDRGAGVRFKGDGVATAYPTDRAETCMYAVVNYASQDPQNPGGGEVEWVARDYGEPGPDNDDTLSVDVTSGPYDRYSKSGTLLGGNLQVHEVED